MANRFWLLTADASRAIIYGGRGPVGTLDELKEFENPDGRSRERELVTDCPGRRSDEGSAHNSALETNVKERTVEEFAKELADFLDRAHAEQQFQHLSIIAAPALLGKLRDKMSTAVRKAVLEEVAKSVTHQPLEKIRQHLTRLHSD